MAEIIIIPPKPCAKDEADCAKAHAMPLWLMKSDGSIVNAADVLCCLLEAAAEANGKPLIVPVISLPDCTPVLISIPCIDGGYDVTQLNEDLEMGKYTLPGALAAPVTKTLEGEISGIITGADGVTTVGEALAFIGFPLMRCKADPTIVGVEATIDDLCALEGMVRFPCGTEYLADPADIDSAVTIPTTIDDRIFVGGKPLGTDGDGAFAGVNVDTPIIFASDDATLCIDCAQYQEVITGKAAIAGLERAKEG